MFWGGSRRPFFLYCGYAMNSLLEQISHHGYLLVFLMVFAEAAGLPAPAALALVAAGAAAAAHILAVPEVLLAAIAGTMLGDLLLFLSEVKAALGCCQSASAGPPDLHCYPLQIPLHP